MYPNSHPQVAAPTSRTVAPETFLLGQDTQQSLPPEAVLALQQVDNLKYFLISAPVDWSPEQVIRRFLLPTGEYVSCVLWSNLFHISGTDIVRCLSFRFQAFGRPVKNSKKFEEGIFSDLRNLKSGTDASLEEPKSGFLDFLYKNNCIRTQKKQKVFYWYSVPHDRLFLDALERDLKREKMGQEATTMAVNEPALSFEYDSSQSLFDQLTKAQQTNSSSFNNNVSTYQQPQAHPPAQMIREVDSMPPPQMMQQSMPVTLAEDSLHHQAYSMPMANPMAAVVKREQYDRNGVPLSQVHLRHHSVPAFMEFSSPAPSLALSHYEEFSNRGMSFEPMTPPQASLGLGPEPSYIANEETGLYSALPEINTSAASFNPLLQMQHSMVAPQYPSVTRSYQPNPVYSVIEGSPTYKQRRRRSSLSAGITAAVAAAGNQHQVHRPSDLRRSMSASVAPVPEGDESPNLSPQSVNGNPLSAISAASQNMNISRHGTPLATVEASPVQESMPVLGHDDMSSFTNGEYTGESPITQHSALHRAAPGVFRRARSATMMELGPYPQKSHSCPIPTCGRLFKRLEHLKRHVRTHTQERPYVCSLCGKAFSRSDNLAQHRRIHEQQQNGEAIDSFSEEDIENEGVEPLEHHLSMLDEEGSPEPETLSHHHHSHSHSNSHAHSHSNSHSHSHSHSHSLSGGQHLPLDMSSALSMSTGTHDMNGANMNGTSMAPPQMITAHNY